MYLNIIGYRIWLLGITFSLDMSMRKRSTERLLDFVSWRETLQFYLLGIQPRLERMGSIFLEGRRLELHWLERFIKMLISISLMIHLLLLMLMLRRRSLRDLFWENLRTKLESWLLILLTIWSMLITVLSWRRGRSLLKDLFRRSSQVLGSSPSILRLMRLKELERVLN